MDILISAEKMPNEFYADLKKACGPHDKFEEERLDGITEAVQVLTAISPAICFVLGMYFKSRGVKESKISIKFPNGPEFSAEGDGVTRLIEELGAIYELHNEPSSDD